MQPMREGSACSGERAKFFSFGFLGGGWGGVGDFYLLSILIVFLSISLWVSQVPQDFPNSGIPNVPEKLVMHQSCGPLKRYKTVEALMTNKRRNNKLIHKVQTKLSSIYLINLPFELSIKLNKMRKTPQN